MNITKEEFRNLLLQTFQEGLESFEDMKENYVDRIIEEFSSKHPQLATIATKKEFKSTPPEAWEVNPYASSEFHTNTSGNPFTYSIAPQANVSYPLSNEGRITNQDSPLPYWIPEAMMQQDQMSAIPTSFEAYLQYRRNQSLASEDVIVAMRNQIH